MDSAASLGQVVVGSKAYSLQAVYDATGTTTASLITAPATGRIAVVGALASSDTGPVVWTLDEAGGTERGQVVTTAGVQTIIPPGGMLSVCDESEDLDLTLVSGTTGTIQLFYCLID